MLVKSRRFALETTSTIASFVYQFIFYVHMQPVECQTYKCARQLNGYGELSACLSADSVCYLKNSILPPSLCLPRFFCLHRRKTSYLSHLFLSASFAFAKISRGARCSERYRKPDRINAINEIESADSRVSNHRSVNECKMH